MELFVDYNAIPECPSTAWDHIYHDRSQHPRTPTTSWFWSPAHTQFLLRSIAAETGRHLNRQNILIDPTMEQYARFEQFIVKWAAHFPTPEKRAFLDREIISQETQEHIRGLRQKEWFYKMCYFKQRPHIMDRPIDTRGRRRYERLSNGTRALNNPHRRYWGEFQEDQTYLKNDSQVPPEYLRSWGAAGQCF